MPCLKLPIAVFHNAPKPLQSEVDKAHVLNQLGLIWKPVLAKVTGRVHRPFGLLCFAEVFLEITFVIILNVSDQNSGVVKP